MKEELSGGAVPLLAEGTGRVATSGPVAGVVDIVRHRKRLD